jgi:hypothetical protein
MLRVTKNEVLHARVRKGTHKDGQVLNFWRRAPGNPEPALSVLVVVAMRNALSENPDKILA